MSRKIVARYLDGRVAKGFSPDFVPTARAFQLVDKDTGEPVEIRFEELKAVFFVKSFEGDSEIRPRDDIERFGLGRKIRVRFLDGETLVGFSAAYRPDRAAFVVFPGDPDNNCDRAVVVRAATESVELL